MNTVDKIKSKLLGFVQPSTELDEILGAFGNSIDNFGTELEKLSRAISYKQTGGKFLDIALADRNLTRNPNETDSMASLRVLNAVPMFKERGSKNGITEELGHLLGISPYIQNSLFAVGVNAIGTRALGSTRSFWIQLWNQTPLTASKITDFFKEISPSRNYYGLDFITVTDGMDGFGSHGEVDFLQVNQTDIVTNGVFDADTDWTKDAPGTSTLTISGGTANFTYGDSTVRLSQVIQAVNQSKKFRLDYEVTAMSGVVSGDFVLEDGNLTTGQIILDGTIGTHSVEIVSAPTGASNLERLLFRLVADNGDTISLDNVELTEIGKITGFIIEDGGLKPIARLATFESTNIDLGSNFANFTWIIDWVDYAQKGKKYSLKVEAHFSADGSTGWTQWEEFGRNQIVQDGQILRYAQWRITFDSNAEALSDDVYMSKKTEYIFRSFILKGLTSNQAIYHTDISGISLQSTIGS